MDVKVYRPFLTSLSVPSLGSYSSAGTPGSESSRSSFRSPPRRFSRVLGNLGLCVIGDPCSFPLRRRAAYSLTRLPFTALTVFSPRSEVKSTFFWFQAAGQALACP